MSDKAAEELAPGQVPEALRRLRSDLSQPLKLIQSSSLKGRGLEPVILALAQASSELYEAEIGWNGPHRAPAQAHVRHAAHHLGDGLRQLQALLDTTPELLQATRATAQTLAALYPVAKAQHRQRRDVLIDPPTSRNRLPPAPEPFGRPRRETPPFQGLERRDPKTPRVFVEVDIGVLSDSHFYTGLSLDLSRGGVFVATYQPLPPGTQVQLFFVLPSGPAVQAPGTVRWTREASDNTPPGMGVAFETLSPEVLALIEHFCNDRAPLYYDAGD